MERGVTPAGYQSGRCPQSGFALEDTNECPRCPLRLKLSDDTPCPLM